MRCLFISFFKTFPSFHQQFFSARELGLSWTKASLKSNKIISIINSGVGWVNSAELFTRLGKRGERKQSNNNGMRIRRQIWGLNPWAVAAFRRAQPRQGGSPSRWLPATKRSTSFPLIPWIPGWPPSTVRRCALIGDSISHENAPDFISPSFWTVNRVWRLLSVILTSNLILLILAQFSRGLRQQSLFLQFYC